MVRGPSGGLSWWEILLGIVVLVGNGWALYLSGGEFCKSGNIRGTLIFANFTEIQQARIQKPAKYLQYFVKHAHSGHVGVVY